MPQNLVNIHLPFEIRLIEITHVYELNCSSYLKKLQVYVNYVREYVLKIYYYPPVS